MSSSVKEEMKVGTADVSSYVHDDDLLVVKHLKKYFPIKSSFFRMTVGNVKAVDDVSFSIKKGTTMGLVGESGCGKSTIGRTILRLQDKTAGEVYFNGTDATYAGVSYGGAIGSCFGSSQMCVSALLVPRRTYAK